MLWAACPCPSATATEQRAHSGPGASPLLRYPPASCSPAAEGHSTELLSHIPPLPLAMHAPTAAPPPLQRFSQVTLCKEGWSQHGPRGEAAPSPLVPAAASRATSPGPTNHAASFHLVSLAQTTAALLITAWGRRRNSQALMSTCSLGPDSTADPACLGPFLHRGPHLPLHLPLGTQRCSVAPTTKQPWHVGGDSGGGEPRQPRASGEQAAAPVPATPPSASNRNRGSASDCIPSGPSANHSAPNTTLSGHQAKPGTTEPQRDSSTATTKAIAQKRGATR